MSQINKIKIRVLANLYTRKKKCSKSQSIPIFTAKFLLIMLINCVFPKNIGKSHKIQGLIFNKSFTKYLSGVTYDNKCTAVVFSHNLLELDDFLLGHHAEQHFFLLVRVHAPGL